MSKGTVSISRFIGATTCIHVKRLVLTQINSLTYILTVLSSWTVDDGKTSADEIILNVDDDKCSCRSDNLHQKWVRSDFAAKLAEMIRSMKSVSSKDFENIP